MIGVTRRALRDLARATCGNAAIEFAFTAPIMLLLIAGSFETGVLFSVYNATNRLATQYAIAWSDCSDSPAGACQAELLVYTAPATIANVVPQLTPASVTLQMFMVQMNGSSPTVVYAYPAAASLSAGQTAAAQAAFASGQTGVVVTATYQHSLTVLKPLMTPILGTKLQPAYTITQLKS